MRVNSVASRECTVNLLALETPTSNERVFDSSPEKEGHSRERERESGGIDKAREKERK